MLLDKTADPAELEIRDSVDQIILFGDLDKNVRRDPAELRVM